MHILFLIGAFLLGSFPTGVVVACAKGVDLRKVGSGNIGTTNVGRALGRGWAALVLLIDAGKGALPVVLAAGLFEQTWLPAAAGLVAALGQVFSVFQRPRRERGRYFAGRRPGPRSPARAGLRGCLGRAVRRFSYFVDRFASSRGQLPNLALAIPRGQPCEAELRRGGDGPGLLAPQGQHPPPGARRRTACLVPPVRISVRFWLPIHPGRRRCSSVT